MRAKITRESKGYISENSLSNDELSDFWTQGIGSLKGQNIGTVNQIITIRTISNIINDTFDDTFDLTFN